jgi:hypothetical protein
VSLDSGSFAIVGLKGYTHNDLLYARQSRTPSFIDDTIPRVPEKIKGYLRIGLHSVSWNKGNLIFVPDHALDKETKDNVGSLAM